jgi:hypothetical protein
VTCEWCRTTDFKAGHSVDVIDDDGEVYIFCSYRCLELWAKKMQEKETS